MRISAAACMTLALALPACEVAYGPTSPSAEWVTYEYPRFVLYTRPGSFCESNAAALAQALEVQYVQTVNRLAIEPGARISLFMYNTGAEVSPPLGSSRSGVAFPETNAVHMVCSPPFDDGLKGLATHEANHVITENGLGRPGTSFMNEGLATALQYQNLGNSSGVFVHGWVRSNRSRLRPLATLIDDSQWDGFQETYSASASFLAYLLERYGPAMLKQVYYTRSADMARRLAEVYGKPLEALEAEWLNGI